MQPFHIRAKELLEEYYREKDEFESNLSETELAKLQEADDKKKAAKVKRKMRAVSGIVSKWLMRLLF